MRKSRVTFQKAMLKLPLKKRFELIREFYKNPEFRAVLEEQNERAAANVLLALGSNEPEFSWKYTTKSIKFKN